MTTRMIWCALLASLAAGQLNPASVAETSIYTYDALGRLVNTANTGGPRNGNTASSRYDPAGNRAAMSVNQALPVENTSVVFSISGPGTIPKGAPATFSIAKAGTASAAVTLNYATADNTATSPAHYIGSSATLTFRPWETIKTIIIPTVEDGLASPARTFSMSISSASTGASISTSSATTTIASSLGNAPVANYDFAIGNVCRGTNVNVTANDTDPNGGYPLTVAGVTQPSAGTATVVSASTIRYHIAYNGPGTVSMTYTVQNTAGYTSTGILEIDICQTAFKRDPRSASKRDPLFRII